MVNYEKYKKIISSKSVKDVFFYIYKNNIWDDTESVSGSGSNLIQTKQIVKRLPDLFTEFRIKSILDLPCGDFNWMSRIITADISYVGGDVVREIIDDNILKYSSNNIKFICLNIIEDKLPCADLILCRDCFVHLSNNEIIKSINNIKKTKIKYLLLTSFTKVRKNIDIITGEWRPVNMEIEPFNLKTIRVINEGCTENNLKYRDKSLILVDLSINNE